MSLSIGYSVGGAHSIGVPGTADAAGGLTIDVVAGHLTAAGKTIFRDNVKFIQRGGPLVVSGKDIPAIGSSAWQFIVVTSLAAIGQVPTLFDSLVNIVPAIGDIWRVPKFSRDGGSVTVFGDGQFEISQPTSGRDSLDGVQYFDSSAPLVAHGATYSGYEFAGIQGFWPNDSSGAQAGQPFGPNLAAMTGPAWKLNTLRLPLNQAQWLGQITYDSVGNMHDADPRRRYRSDIIQQVQAATDLGMKVVIVLHWSAPASLAPMGLQMMADADNSPRWWASVSNALKGFPNVSYELYNEPFFDFRPVLSGGTSWQVLKNGGVMRFAEISSNNGSFRQVYCMSLVNALGEFRPRSVITDGVLQAIATYHDMARNKLYYHVNGTQTGTPPAFAAGASLTTLTRATKPMIGRGLPAVAPSGVAANAVDANYNNPWRSVGALPQLLEIDITSVIGSVAQPINGSRPLLVLWVSEDTPTFDLNEQPQTAYNEPRDYTIEVNASPTGGTWIPIKSVVGNTFTSRAHLINGFGYSRIGMRPSSVNGSAGNADCKLQIDIWDASDTVTGTFGTGLGTAVTDGFLFIGDSITQLAMKHSDTGTVPCPSFGDTVFATTGHRPPYQNAGMPNWATADFLADDGFNDGLTVLEHYLSLCPLKYVTLAIGSNDAGPNLGLSVAGGAAGFVANMLAMAAKIALYGKVAIIPTIPFSTNAQRNANVVILNNAMTAALASHPEILVGPDVYSYFQANPTLIRTTDFLHPTDQGCANLRTILWGGWAANTLYSARATIVSPSIGWQSAGTQAMVDAIRAAGSTQDIIAPGISYSNDLSQWLANVPTDPLNKIVAGWHAYPPIQAINTASVQTGGTAHVVGDVITLAQPNTVYTPARITVTGVSGGAVTSFTFANRGQYLQSHLPVGAIAQGSTTGIGTGFSLNALTWSNVSAQWSMPANWPTVQAIADQYPVIITETGEHNATGTVGAPFLADLLPWAIQYSIGVIAWTWDVFNQPDDVLIKDVNGTPSDGYGVDFAAWSASVVDTGSQWYGPVDFTILGAPLVIAIDKTSLFIHGDPVNRVLDAGLPTTPGHLALIGRSINIQRNYSADTAHLVITGKDMPKLRNLFVTPAHLTIAGATIDANLNTLTIVVNAGRLIAAGKDVAIARALDVLAAHLNIVGKDVEIGEGFPFFDIVVDMGHLNIGGLLAGIERAPIANPGHTFIRGHDVTINVTRKIDLTGVFRRTLNLKGTVRR